MASLTCNLFHICITLSSLYKWVIDGRIIDDLNIDFIISIGDNFCEDGIIGVAEIFTIIFSNPQHKESTKALFYYH